MTTLPSIFKHISKAKNWKEIARIRYGFKSISDYEDWNINADIQDYWELFYYEDRKRLVVIDVEKYVIVILDKEKKQLEFFDTDCKDWYINEEIFMNYIYLIKMLVD